MTGFVATLIAAIGGGGILGFVGLLLQVRSLNKKLTNESKKLDTESTQIIAKTATDLLQTVNSELNDAQIELKDLRLMVKNLTSELFLAQNQAESLNKQLKSTQTRATYFEHEYKRLISKDSL